MFMFRILHIPTAKFVLTDDCSRVRDFYGSLAAKEFLLDSMFFIETKNGILMISYRTLDNSFDDVIPCHFSVVQRDIEVDDV